MVICHSHTEHKMTIKFRKEVNCFRSSNKSSPQNTEILRLRSNFIENKRYVSKTAIASPSINVCLTKLYFSFAPLGGSIVSFF